MPLVHGPPDRALSSAPTARTATRSASIDHGGSLRSHVKPWSGRAVDSWWHGVSRVSPGRRPQTSQAMPIRRGLVRLRERKTEPRGLSKKPDTSLESTCPTSIDPLMNRGGAPLDERRVGEARTSAEVKSSRSEDRTAPPECAERRGQYCRQLPRNTPKNKRD